MNSPTVGLYQTEGIFCPLLVALCGGPRSTFALTNVVNVSALSLLLHGAPRINRPGKAICALVHVWHMAGRLVIADNVLPCVALLAQDGVTVIVGKATYAFDRGRFFLLYRPVWDGRAVGVGRWCGTVGSRYGSWLRFSVRLDRRDVSHNLADTLKRRAVGWYCGWLRLYVLWIA
jgi:hypothetical protein